MHENFSVKEHRQNKKLLAELLAIPFVGLTTPSERGHNPDGLKGLPTALTFPSRANPLE